MRIQDGGTDSEREIERGRGRLKETREKREVERSLENEMVGGCVMLEGVWVLVSV